MEMTIQKVLGELGEYCATTYLDELGIRTCRADKINWIGHSLLIPDSLKEFDCNNLHRLAQLCEELLECNVNDRPCKDPNSIFYSFNPNPITLLNFPNTGDDKFRYYCAINMTYLAILDQCKSVCKIDICPIKSYLKVDNYIHNFYNHYPKKFNLDDPPQHKEWSKLWYGHPGRIDLFGFKDGNYYCFEVKVNTSILSRWQIIRLNWMKCQGYNSHILLVSLTNPYKKELVNLYHNMGIADLVQLLKPSCEIKEFHLADYKNSEEFVPIHEDLEYYNRTDYHWFCYKSQFLKQIDL
jgi:hypothetical protein